MVLLMKARLGGTQTGSYQTGSYQKGRFIPPKAKIVIFVVFCWAKHPSTKQLLALPTSTVLWVLIPTTCSGCSSDLRWSKLPPPPF